MAGSLEAGRDIALQGWNRNLSNADYTVGGYLFTQDLSGQGIELLIPHENVIVANGDVQFTQNYVGESLHVLAGGQVSQATGVNGITVTTGTPNGSITERIGNGTGGSQFVTVTATDQPTVDIRSGVGWLNLLSELPGNFNTSELPVTFRSTTGEGIELGNITNHGGDIALISAADIITNNLNTSVSIFSPGEDITGGNGGAVSIAAEENIDIHLVDTSSSSSSFAYSDSILEAFSANITGGNGGAVSIVAGQSISVGFIDSTSSSVSFAHSDSSYGASSGNVTGGDGGAVSLFAGQEITANSIAASSSAQSQAYSLWYSNMSSGEVTGGDGGAISLFAEHGITANSIAASASSLSLGSSQDIIGGNGGELFLATEGNINIGSISSSSTLLSSSGNIIGGNSGSLSLFAGQNINIGAINLLSHSNSASYIYSGSSSGSIIGGNGGDLFLVAGQNINVDSINLSSDSDSFSDKYWYLLYWHSSSGDIVGGDGGDLSLLAGQNIEVGSIDLSSASSSYSFSASFSSSGDMAGGDGGDLSLLAGQNIKVGSIDSSSSSYSFSSSRSYLNSGDIIGGDGGTLSLVAGQSIDIDHSIHSFTYSSSSLDLLSSSFRPSQPNLNPGDVVGGDGGDIFLTASTGAISASQNSMLQSFSVTEKGLSGNGGNVVISANTYIQNLDILTTSSSAQSGVIQITGLSENFGLLNTSVKIHQLQPINIVDSLWETMTISVGEEGQSADINILGTGNLSFINSAVFSNVNDDEPAGNITITSPGLITFDNSLINTNTNSSGQAASITLNAHDLIIRNGSAIETNTSGSGDAGDIKFNVSNAIALSDSTVASRTTASSTGDSGDINIDPVLTQIYDGGRLEVNAVGQGQGGNILLTSDNLLLNHGFITTTAASGRGGNIELNIQDLLFIDNASLISASAGTTQTGGDGGNITISIPNGFLVAPMGADSDIVAQAYEGTGGNIDITARSIYGFVEQPAVPGNGMNDINASSQLRQRRQVNLSNLRVDSRQDVMELPVHTLATAQLINRSCQVQHSQQLSSFVFKGYRGLPPTLTGSIRHPDGFALEDLGPAIQTTNSRELSSLLQSASHNGSETVSSLDPEEQIIEAQTWVRNANGQLILQAGSSNTNAERVKLFASSCQ